jgi:hypothetical protein
MRSSIPFAAALAILAAPALSTLPANAASPTNLGSAVTKQVVTPVRQFEDNSGRWREKYRSYYKWRRRVFHHQHK